MNWNKAKSITLSLAFVGLFMLALAALDISAYWLTVRYAYYAELPMGSFVALLAVIYAASVFGWILLFKMYGLLRALLRGEVFTAENVSRLRTVSWCCLIAAVILAAGACFRPLLVLFGLAVAAGFMGLIVRIVKNAFQQAAEMKSELDFTV